MGKAVARKQDRAFAEAQRRIAEAAGLRVPLDVRQRRRALLQNAAFQEGELLEADLHRGIDGERLSDRLRAGQGLRGGRARQKESDKKNECRSHMC